MFEHGFIIRVQSQSIAANMAANLKNTSSLYKGKGPIEKDKGTQYTSMQKTQ